MENNGEESKDTAEKLYGFMIEQLKAGADKYTIIQKLEEMGISKNDAEEITESLYPQIVKALKEEHFTVNSVVPAILGGGIAAAIGGGIWGFIVIASGYVIGFMAWGIGWLCGFGVVLFSKGRRGIPLQIIAVLSSVFGIAIGKYITFFHFLKKALTEKHGVEIASNVSFFSGKVIQFFMERIDTMVSGFDILWIILAVITAWKIPKGSGIKLSTEQISTTNIGTDS